jgi:opacity protein-like surface antigen
MFLTVINMRTKILLLLLLANATNAALAQSLRYTLAQPYISLSAYSRQQSDPLSFTGNQAALAQSKNAGVGVFAERRFMLSETTAYTLGASLPTRLGNFGIQLNYAGFKNFNENKIGLAYARKLGKLVDLGVQFNYYSYRVPAYGNASAINFEIGAMLHLTDKLNAGIHVYNPVGGKLGKNDDEKIAASYKAGLGYDVSEKLFVSSEIIKEEDKAVNVIAGLQYQFAKQFFAKAGFISESATAYVGAGVGWKNLRLDISSSYHPQLGFSPGILVIMNFKPKAE